MIATRIKKFLDRERVLYTHATHPIAYTAEEVADEEHVPAFMMAKTVVLNSGDGFVLAVVPAPWRVNLGAVAAALNKPGVRLAAETEFAGLFPDSEVGAMAPFGNLYGIPVYVDQMLAREKEIVFNAGTHRDTIRMRYADFERLVGPKVLQIAVPPSAIPVNIRRVAAPERDGSFLEEAPQDL